jgi:hypothetical protein
MSTVDFGEAQNTGGFAKSYQNPEDKGMVGLLIKWGVTDNAKTANIILLIIALAFFGLSIYLSLAFLIPPSAPAANTADIGNPLRDRINQVQQPQPVN